MRALVCENYGAPEVLQLRELPRPQPKKGEVLVQVAALSLNTSDWECVTGQPFYVRVYGLFRPKQPILGSDITGRVVALGEGVESLQLGDEVFGDAMGTFGGFAEYVAVPEKVLAKKPSSVSFEQAATLPQAAVIALQALRQGGGVTAGQKVLINGAGGGSGMFAIQMAKNAGAEVTGVDNAQKQEHMLALGADHVFDYREVDFTKTTQQYDLVIDLVGRRSVFAHRRALRRGGCYTMVGGSMSSLLQNLLLGPIVGFFTRTKMGILVVEPDHRDIEVILGLIEEGQIRVLIDKRFPLTETAAALSYLGQGSVLGKVVIEV
ncbi:MAG: NAD(P)-dependent alcohol dehydrogenase [Polyangiaceae bacterium]|nr:NAD(P)-dependent alcohol dehydrogenase [Polyangiaceae bacterium]